jgi:F0F1-type ATP synthase membrane subunit b/b'
MSSVLGKTAAMSERSIPLGQEFESGDSDPADPAAANLQQSANLANENCDRAVALAQTLSAQLRDAQDRINQLEREAEGLGDQLLAEAKAIIQEVRSNADARVNRTIQEADERIDRLKADAQNQIGRLQNELAQTTRGIDQVKEEAGTRIESVKMEADARVDATETEAKKRVDDIRRESEDKVLRLRADLTEAKNRADRAEQCLMFIRREIEHQMPAMRDGPKPTNSAARPRLLTQLTPSRSSASMWFRRLWLRVTSAAALGCRVRDDIEPATSFDRAPEHEPEFSNGLSVSKTGNTVTAGEPAAALRSGGNSAALSSVTAG